MSMADEVRIGVITPSGNIAVERVTNAILAGLPGVFPHYTRIALHGDQRKKAVDTYDFDEMIGAAELLSHAKPRVICWNGSIGGSYGFTPDEELCRRIEEKTGTQAVTSALAVRELLRTLKATSYVLITPYHQAYQDKLIAEFGRQGFACAAERHSDLRDNLSYGDVSPEAIAVMAKDAVRQSRPDAIVMFCTNFFGAPAAQPLEDALGIPVLDAVAAGVWASLKATGVDRRRVRGWGRMFSL